MQNVNLYSLLDKKFVGVDDLRKQLTDILDKLPKEKEVVITQNGKPRGALMDIKTFLKIKELEDEIADYNPKLIKRVNAAVKDARKGNVVPAEEVWRELGL